MRRKIKPINADYILEVVDGNLKLKPLNIKSMFKVKPNPRKK